MDQQIILPTPSITTSNDYFGKLTDSHLLPSPGFTNKYDPQGEYIVIGCGNGEKVLVSTASNKVLHVVGDEEQNPITCVRWRPTINSKAKVVGICIADGRFEYWHIPSMKRLFSIREEENSLLCCDFDSTGQRFATAGKDCNIRVYDESTKCVNSLLGKAQWNYSGHSNRIFSMKFINENTIISGGWDSVIHIWDIRHLKSVKSFYGPHLAGDSLDFKDNTILTGCYASKNQIQLWDFRNFQQMQTINWPCEKEEVAYVYTACFGHDKSTIIAGASGVNEVRIFAGQSKHSFAVKIFDLKQGCYSVDASKKDKNICFSTAKQGFFVCNYGKV